MKVSLNWAKQFTDIDLPLEKLVEKIGSQLGAVEEVVDLGQRYKGVVVVRIVACEKHPNADKLTVCLVDDGGVVKKMPRDTNGLVQIVCGAQNVSAGMLAAWIPPGTTVPSTFGKEPFVLEAREIRGAVSNGMLASPKELAFGDNHEGLLVIDEDSQPGRPFSGVYNLNDHIIDIENKMFTHRPDCFGILGVAREIAGISGRSFKSPSWYLKSPSFKTDSETPLPLEVKNAVGKMVPRLCAVTMSGVSVAPSPMWLQSYLMRVGIRPINNIVDLTNFVMYETAQPVHAYDYDKVAGPKLTVRHPRDNEELRLLGGKTIQLQANDLVIADAKKAIGLGGVMGGMDSDVDEQTKNIILECANFDTNAVRDTAMYHGLFTDAAVRFTKGQSSRQNLPVLAKLVDDIRRIAGGRLASPLYDVKSTVAGEPKPLKVGVEFINSRLGENLSAATMSAHLSNVEMAVSISGADLKVLPPFWRTDLEIAEDVVEEVGRLHGYDHLPLVLPQRSLLPPPQNKQLVFKQRLREISTRAGANEVLTYSFVRGAIIEAAGQDLRKAYHLRNAISPDLQYYRLSLGPSLLEKIHPNIKAGFDKMAIFEIGVVHQKNVLDHEKLPLETGRFGLVVTDTNPRDGGAGFYQAKRYCGFILANLGIGKVTFKTVRPGTLSGAVWRAAAEALEPTRSAEIFLGKEHIGLVGEPNSKLRMKLKLPPHTALLELDLEALQNLADPSGRYETLHRFPSLGQDICFKLPAPTTFGQANDFIDKFLDSESAEHGYHYDLAPVSIFQHANDTKHKQITWHLDISHPQRTLTTEEINRLLDRLAKTTARIKAVRI